VLEVARRELRLGLALARRVEIGGTAVTVIPADRGLCVRTANSTACAPRAQAERRGVFVVADCVPGASSESGRVAGVVPDGVERVTVAGRDGQPSVSDVTHGVFAVTIDDRPAGVTWHRRTGDEHAVLPDPGPC
jgi:hypothetical protein